MESASFNSLFESVLTSIDEICKKFDCGWQRRSRIIDTKLILLFIFQTVTSKNSQGYSTTLNDVWNHFKGKGNRPRKDEPVAPSSMCEARQKLDENIFKEINQKIVSEFESSVPKEDLLWNGLKLFAVDGSKINVPPELFDLGFNVTNKERRSAQGMASCLFHLKTRIPYDFSLDSHGNERIAAEAHLTYLNKDDCVIYDRGYFSYAMLLEHKKRGVHAVFRLSNLGVTKVIQAFIDDPNSPNDVTVTLNPTLDMLRDLVKRYSKDDLPPIRLRLIRYQIEDKIFFLATTLPDAFSIEIFPELYHARWGVEEFYKIPKAFFQIEDFHAKSPRGVRQELFAGFVLTTLTRVFTHQVEKSSLKTKNEASSVIKKNQKVPNQIRKMLQQHLSQFEQTSSTH